ncbi:hypothetical protein DERF_005397 [Dermatophagoides farinae]|uniref:Uncharacterized protein n=1 Tax=Dermatophagoides farinae TaxID=6954 RepID=A0A922I5K2_DERFA|nr:hypothetical protein DERF_005397 [Dermatophagoides farinae]
MFQFPLLDSALLQLVQTEFQNFFVTIFIKIINFKFHKKHQGLKVITSSLSSDPNFNVIANT